MIWSFACLLLASGADNITAAKSALDEGLPAVAITKLEGMGRLPKDPEAAFLLARACLDDGKPSKAIDVLSSLPAGSTRDFWLAQADAALGRWEEALAGYRSARRDASFSEEALIGEARMLRNLGKFQEAITLLEETDQWSDSPLRRLAVLESSEVFLDLHRPDDAQHVLGRMTPADSREKSRRDYLLARSLSLAGNEAGAIMLYDAVTPLDPDMAAGLVTGKAHSLVQLGQSPAAENLLEDFISKNPDLPGLEKVFFALDSVYAAQAAASSSELRRWSDGDERSLRKRLANFYLARFEARSGREERMEKLLQNVLSDSGHPSLEPASLEMARIRLKQARPAEALPFLPPQGTLPSADFLRGTALTAMGNPAQASPAFLSAASDPAFEEAALYNAAVCDLLAGSKISRGLELLQARYPASPRIHALLLQQAYGLAKNHDVQAIEVFQDLARSGDVSMASEAALAIAEWKYENHDPAGARQDLIPVSTSGSEEQRAQADALSVFLTDDGTSEEPGIAAARKYLAAHPGESSEPEVMMKLGELLFRKGDFAGARVQFESLAKKYPGTPPEFPALFLAAQSASHLQTPTSINEAMLLYEEVASSNSTFASRARFEQAVLQNVLGKPGEAIVILDRLIASPGNPDIRAAALLEKGKTLYNLGSSDPKSYSDAIEVWRLVASDPGLSPASRSQALSRIGSAYEKLGDSEAAVAAYYDVIKDPRMASQAFFWFYKSGFAAARLLESSKRWDQAIKVYEMIAAAGGPRSEEATSRINKIRLENFLWDEPAGG